MGTTAAGGAGGIPGVTQQMSLGEGGLERMMYDKILGRMGNRGRDTFDPKIQDRAKRRAGKRSKSQLADEDRNIDPNAIASVPFTGGGGFNYGNLPGMGGGRGGPGGKQGGGADGRGLPSFLGPNTSGLTSGGIGGVNQMTDINYRGLPGMAIPGLSFPVAAPPGSGKGAPIPGGGGMDPFGPRPTPPPSAGGKTPTTGQNPLQAVPRPRQP